jgi:outer membrane protein OmpA-like peptidoglycan-associated protein
VRAYVRIATVATWAVGIVVVSCLVALTILIVAALSNCKGCPVAAVARDDEAHVEHNEPLRIEVLKNDTGQGLLAIVKVGAAQRGNARIDRGQILYQPSSSCGLDSFTYRIRDETGTEAEAKVTVRAKRLDASAVELRGLEPFMLNRAELTDAGKCLLQRFAERLAATEPRGTEQIRFTGHACSIGSQQRNNDLAHARATAASTYLADQLAQLNADVWLNRMSEPRGVGSRQALPETRVCEQSRRDPRAYEQCLAPNRRVVVELR